jgi:hypothetical protein
MSGNVCMGRTGKVVVHSALGSRSSVIFDVDGDGKSWKKVNDGVSGYLSHSTYPLYFGLGEADAVDTISVTWPSGVKQVVAGPLETNRLLTITEE